MYDALNDPMLRPALNEFFRTMRVNDLEMLVNAVRSNERDTMREALLAGKVNAYETAMSDLDHFAKEQLEAQ